MRKHIFLWGVSTTYLFFLLGSNARDCNEMNQEGQYQNQNEQNQRPEPQPRSKLFSEVICTNSEEHCIASAGEIDESLEPQFMSILFGGGENGTESGTEDKANDLIERKVPDGYLECVRVFFKHCTFPDYETRPEYIAACGNVRNQRTVARSTRPKKNGARVTVAACTIKTNPEHYANLVQVINGPNGVGVVLFSRQTHSGGFGYMRYNASNEQSFMEMRPWRNSAAHFQIKVTMFDTEMKIKAHCLKLKDSVSEGTLSYVHWVNTCKYE